MESFAFSKIWSPGVAVTRGDQWAFTTGPYISAVNDMIDSAGRRVAGLQNRVPKSVLSVILAVAPSMDLDLPLP